MTKILLEGDFLTNGLSYVSVDTICDLPSSNNSFVKETFPANLRCVWRRSLTEHLFVFELSPKVVPIKYHNSYYENVGSYNISLPYIILMRAVLDIKTAGKTEFLSRTGWDSLFFRKEPLQGINDELLFPFMPNIFALDSDTLSCTNEICNEYVSGEMTETILKGRRIPHLCTGTERTCRSIVEKSREIISSFYNASFNNEEAYSIWENISPPDIKVGNMKSWERATKEDSNFALGVNWWTTGLTLRRLRDRFMCEGHSGIDVRRAVFAQ